MEQNSAIIPGQNESKIQAYQLRRIRHLVRHAYDNVPLYRRKYDSAGIKPGDIRTLSDFKTLPVLTKEELQSGFPDDILSKRVNPKSCYVVSTSGHSGSPVKLYRRKSELRIIPFGYFMLYPWLPLFIKQITGVNTGWRVSAILPRDESYDLFQAVKAFAVIPPMLRKGLQFIATESDTAEMYEAINMHNPDIIASDLSALKNIVSYASARNLPLPAVKLLFVGSELIDRGARNLLQEAFKARLIEHYGSEEAGTIAIECPRGDGLHILWRVNMVEILNNGKDVPNGTPGQMVVTNLLNTATPIIRYAGMGDIATISATPCSCKANTPLLKMIDGRMVDSFYLPDGRTVHPFRLTIPMEHIPGVLRYQIRQERKDFVRVLLLPSAQLEGDNKEAVTRELSSRIIAGLGEILGGDVRIEVKLVDDLPQPPGSRHKLQPVISLVERR
jgi:phenylacetate-CoA ligase